MGKIRSVSESSYDVTQYYARADMMSAVAEKALPPIQPSDVGVQAQVSVSFEIKQ